MNHIDFYSKGSLLHDSLVSLWRAPALNWWLNAALTIAPFGVRRWVERERTRVRETDLQTQIQQRSRLVSEPEFRELLSRGLRELVARSNGTPLGDYLEFGVYNGTSLICMYRELLAQQLDHVRLFGFDSFQGLPPDADQEDEGRWRPGACCSPLGFTQAVLHSEGIDPARVSLVPGWFDDTLNEQTRRERDIRRASIVMIDCDVYSSAKTALTFCAPLLADHALMLFDEWSPYRLEDRVVGERKAFAEFLEESDGFTAEPFGSYTRRAQAFMVSRR